jgi:acetyl-CoA carboxylase carboxyl transferase subunit beta
MDLKNLFNKISFDRKKEQPSKKDAPSHWIKCPECSSLMFFKEVENQNNICPKCNFHMRIGAKVNSLKLILASHFCKKERSNP